MQPTQYRGACILICCFGCVFVCAIAGLSDKAMGVDVHALIRRMRACPCRSRLHLYMSSDKDQAAAKESLKGAIFANAQVNVRVRPLTHLNPDSNRYAPRSP